MSITLLTGLPGNGKTLYAISKVKAIAEKEGRPVFYARIKGLTLPWTLIDPYEWYKCPPNSIIVIDECQKADNPEDPKAPSLFGVRQRGAPVPIWASKLEDHRHGGVDLYLITQDPMLIDGHDRKLCQRHLHFVRTFGMARATIHEFTNGPRDQVAKSRTGSIRHEWKFPKEAYKWYQSAEVHTVKAAVPIRVWLLLVIPLLIALIVYGVAQRWSEKATKGKPAQGAQAAQLAPGEAPAPKGSPQAYVANFVPRVPGLAYTAPAYDEVTKPVTAPYPAACVQSKSRCQCYTQQGTRLEVQNELCEGIVAGGFFVAWNQPLQPAVPVAQAAAKPVVAESLPGYVSLGGQRSVPAVASQDPPPQGEGVSRAKRPPA